MPWQLSADGGLDKLNSTAAARVVRKHTPYLKTCQIVDLLCAKHVQNQIMQLQMANSLQFFKLDLFNYQKVDIAGSFLPQSAPQPINQVDVLNNNQFQYLFSQLSLQLQKTYLDFIPVEFVHTTYQHDTLSSENMLWRIIQQQSQLQLYLRSESVTLLQLVHQSSKQESKWIIGSEGREQRRLLHLVPIKYGKHLHRDMILRSREASSEVLRPPGDTAARLETSFILTENPFSFGDNIMGHFVQVYDEEFLFSLEHAVQSRKKRGMKYQEEELLDFCWQMLQVLDRYAQRGEVHSAISPSNIVYAKLKPERAQPQQQPQKQKQPQPQLERSSSGSSGDAAAYAYKLVG